MNQPNENTIDKTDINNGLIVSTVESIDFGLETFISDTSGMFYLVEAYSDIEKAKEGHTKWTRFCTCKPVMITLFNSKAHLGCPYQNVYLDYQKA